MGKHKSFIVLGTAVFIALITSILIYKVLQGKAYQKERAVETRPVAVALTDLAWGTSLAKEMVKMVPYPKDFVPPGCFSDAESLSGRVLIYPIKINEPIFESRLAPVNIKMGGVAAVIGPKKRAVSVKVDKVIGVSGFIHAGNRVDVLVTIAVEKSSTSLTKIVLENILVLAVGPEVEKKGKEPTPVDVITLEVSPQEAEKLALAATEGKIQLALRNFNDTEDVLTKGTTVPALLASYSGDSPGTKARAVSRGGSDGNGSRTAKPRAMTVELIKGNKMQEVKFERSE